MVEGASAISFVSIHKLRSILPLSNILDISFRISNSFSRYGEAIRMDKSIILLFRDLISTLIFLSANSLVALPYPVIDCIIVLYLFGV
ncbi:hypothetical protein EZS27_043022 [termite gut metagenome]|uniref:Uncharacterized protein n=1 Tax=termite gut metagenome TaxID=433724 RepID=A0A5J4P7B0_9ZZZZ